jgi:hypothetical protein
VYTIIVLPVLVSIELKIWWIGIVATVVAAALLALQTVMLIRFRNTLEYLAYLAGRAKDPEPSKDPDILYRARHFRWCLRGMNRIGNLYAGRHFRDLVLKALRERTCIVPLSLSIDQMIAAIESALVDAASKKSKDQIYRPFEDALNEDLFNAHTFTISKFSILLATQYCAVDAVTKEQVEAAYQKKHISPATVETLGKLAPFITAVVGVVTAVYTLVEKIQK